MAYCRYCGINLPKEAKFCAKCGNPVKKKDDTQREHDFIGKVVKCPACGMEISSFTAICPGCGHEINSVKVAVRLNEFSNLMNSCDIAIAENPGYQSIGCDDWNILILIFWIIVNIITCCVPGFFYGLLSIGGIVGMRPFTVEEKKKINYINNTVFPYDRENILGGILYMRDQVDALLSGEINRTTYKWIRIWRNKAKQLYDKAEILFKGDKIAEDAYADIVKKETEVKKTLQLRFALTVLATCIVTVIIVVILKLIAS